LAAVGLVERHLGLDLLGAVLGAVDVEVEPDAEQVLVHWRDYALGHRRGVRAGLAGGMPCDMIPVSLTSSLDVPVE
jgi:hypothetical protein